MDWIEKFNKTIEYIEEHLEDEIDNVKLGEIAHCSTYHYQRMFAYMSNIPLSEYIRRRRMTMAVNDLRNGEKIIDIALKYGYSSPTSFNRAFQNIHGIPPSKAKESGVQLKSFSPITFKITIQGAEEMNYRIEDRGEIRILGISTAITKEMEENFKAIPQMWGKASMDGTVEKLITLMNGELKGVLGVTVYENEDDWKYYIGVESNSDNAYGFEEHVIPKSKWAIFSGEGSGISIQELLKRIFTEWLPNSEYEYGNAADIELYTNPDPKNTKYEVWIPIVKNNSLLRDI
ncbi:MAG: AraC family transcriptional regulator [Tissierellia bacterium]|nr:AraC family transcriptional regulator [Tissierellia bacterium]